jgi:hypothetical protein
MKRARQHFESMATLRLRHSDATDCVFPRGGINFCASVNEGKRRVLTDCAKEMAVMLGTNRQFEALMLGLNVRITNMERAVLAGTAGSSAAMLEDLWARRRSLRLLMLNRRVEAAKPIVDFQRWRDGNGARHLFTDTEETSRQMAN